MDTGKKPLGNETRAPKDETTAPVPVPASEAPAPMMVVKEKKHYQSKRFVLWRTVVILLLIAATAIVVAGWFYTQDLYSQLNKKEAEVTALQTAKTNDSSDTQLTGGKDFIPQSAVSAVVIDYLAANTSYSGSDATFVHEIKYLDDMFARVDILELDKADKDKKTVVTTFFLKNVATEEQVAADDANRWVLIWTEDTLTTANKEYLKNTFGVTDDAFTKIREE